MKITFLCGSMEPGRDGVGDYVRRLCAELALRGHLVAVVALNDHFTTGIFDGVQDAGEASIRVLRLPATIPVKLRFSQAKSWIDDQDPEWLSMQFVPFAFHPKGLPFGLADLLSLIGAGRRWHFMFHELWVGMNIESPAKMIWWGRAQKWLIKSILKSVKPEIIHTQTRLYQTQLAGIGFKAEYLPLFSNIPVLVKSEVMQIARIDNCIPGDVTFVIFGSIHQDAPVDSLASEAVAWSHKTGRNITLKIIGRCGHDQERWASTWRSHALTIDMVGEQPAAIISGLLSASSIGISTTALPLVEKSGAAAAMREHGLPVLCVAPPWNPIRIAKPLIPIDILEYKPGNLENCLATKIEFPPICNASQVAEKLERALEKIPVTSQVQARRV